MPVLRYKGHPVLTVFRNRSGEWTEGDEVEVSEADAEYILGGYPDLFEVVGAAPAKPAKDRAVKSPKRKPVAKKSAAKGKK